MSTNAPVSPESTYLGNHIIADLLDCENIPTWSGALISLLTGASRESECLMVAQASYDFTDNEVGGASACVLLAESHIAIHTWPEHNFASLCIFVCGEKATPSKALEYVEQRLKPGTLRVKAFMRGENVSP